MRRIIASINISIDGFIAGEDGALDWQFDYWTSDMTRLLAEQLSAADTILLGRKTYDVMAAHWPLLNSGLALQRDDIAFAMLMNNHQKIVCSNNLKTAHWNNTHVYNGDIDSQISQLKTQQGKDIIIYGSCTLIRHLAQKKLIDVYRLWVYPVALGRGIPLFNGQLPMTLSGSQQFMSGVTALNYQL
jgi:dihydrofolate reductase